MPARLDTFCWVPELLEVEYYRQLAESALGRRIEAVDVPDPHCLAGPLTPAAIAGALVGKRLVAARRQGKLLLLDTSGPVLGMRFGMTGTLVVDGRRGVDRLLSSANEAAPRYLRFELGLEGGGGLALSDPRRFGRLLLDPDTAVLGPDALDATQAQFDRALDPGRGGRGGGAAVKARLLEQHRLAGLGNLLVDEILWQAGIDPRRPLGRLDAPERRLLRRTMRSTLRRLLRRGGSHLGDMTPERRPGGVCPRDGEALVRGVVGGRTTWWCPAHQR